MATYKDDLDIIKAAEGDTGKLTLNAITELDNKGMLGTYSGSSSGGGDFDVLFKIDTAYDALTAELVKGSFSDLNLDYDNEHVSAGGYIFGEGEDWYEKLSVALDINWDEVSETKVQFIGYVIQNGTTTNIRVTLYNDNDVEIESYIPPTPPTPSIATNNIVIGGTNRFSTRFVGLHYKDNKLYANVQGVNGGANLTVVNDSWIYFYTESGEPISQDSLNISPVEALVYDSSIDAYKVNGNAVVDYTPPKL